MSYTFTPSTTSFKGYTEINKCCFDNPKNDNNSQLYAVSIELLSEVFEHDSGTQMLSETQEMCERGRCVEGGGSSYIRVVDCVWGGGRGACGRVCGGLSLLLGWSSPVYASSSKPMPTLCPPALKFFPSIRAERVTLTPADTEYSFYGVKGVK